MYNSAYTLPPSYSILIYNQFIQDKGSDWQCFHWKWLLEQNLVTWAIIAICNLCFNIPLYPLLSFSFLCCNHVLQQRLIFK